jgi:RsiW-degrading membrane proteinase PrsW (M82 family)
MCCLLSVLIVLLVTIPFVGILFLLAIAPAFLLVFCCYCWSFARRSVRINSVVRTFWMGVLLTIPIAVIEGIIVTVWTAAGGQSNVGEDNARPMKIGWAIGTALFLSFLVAAFCEETLKYLLVRAQYHRPIYYTPYGMALLGMAGALGFATIENLMYVLLYGFVTAIVRAVVSVPFHATTGLIIGTMLARHKYLHANGQNGQHEHFRLYLEVIWLPILLHGLFNFPLLVIAMTHKQDTPWAVFQLFSLAVLIIAIIIFYVLSRPLKHVTIVAGTTGPAGTIGNGPAVTRV